MAGAPFFLASFPPPPPQGHLARHHCPHTVNSDQSVQASTENLAPPFFDRESPGARLSIYFSSPSLSTQEIRMDAIQDREPPRLKADVDSLKRELERAYQTVQATRGERREPMTPALSAVGMVIRGK